MVSAIARDPGLWENILIDHFEIVKLRCHLKCREIIIFHDMILIDRPVALGELDPVLLVLGV